MAHAVGVLIANCSVADSSLQSHHDKLNSSELCSRMAAPIAAFIGETDISVRSRTRDALRPLLNTEQLNV